MHDDFLATRLSLLLGMLAIDRLERLLWNFVAGVAPFQSLLLGLCHLLCLLRRLVDLLQDVAPAGQITVGHGNAFDRCTLLHRLGLLLVATNQLYDVFLLIGQLSQLFVCFLEAVFPLEGLLLWFLAPRLLLLNVEILQVCLELLLVFVVDQRGKHLLDVKFCWHALWGLFFAFIWVRYSGGVVRGCLRGDTIVLHDRWIILLRREWHYT